MTPLSSLARDVLAIPASGAGVERLLNSARDICHYRRGHLKSCTIKDLMMWMCTSNFELEQEQLELMKEYLPASEVAATEKEERASVQLQADFEPVSDNEDDTGDIGTEIQERTAKRQCIEIGIGDGGQQEEQHVQQPYEIDDEIEHPLPQNEVLARGTKRIRKAPRGFEDYEIIKP